MGHSISWGALLSFVRNLGVDSATFRAMNPDLSPWSTTLKTNTILADIYDMLAQINSNLVAIGSHKPSKPAKAYPRPGDEHKNDKNRIGSGALPHKELAQFFVNKRKNYG